MDYKELEKMYGIRIPIFEQGEYYLKQLFKSKSYSKLKDSIEHYKSLESILTGEETMKSIKYKCLDSSVKHLKELYGDKINKWESPINFVLSHKEFKPIEDVYYVSFDMREANWNMIRTFIAPEIKTTFSEYVQEKLGFPKCIAESKSLRQAILGQIANPKRYTRMQEYLTYNHLTQFEGYNISIINSEEIGLSFNKDNIKNFIEKIDSFSFSVPVKIDIYRVKKYENFGDIVNVKEHLDRELNIIEKSFYDVNGHRFYLHFKTLILGEKVEDNDILFRLEKKLFKYCGKDYKDFKEYEYVKKYIKPLKWVDADSALVDEADVLYYVLSKTESEVKIFDVKEKSDVYLDILNYDYKEAISDYHLKKISKYID